MEMCLAIPGKVVAIKGTTATLDILGVLREASIELLPDVHVGDYLILHAGCAIEKVNEEEATTAIDLFKELKEVMGP